MRHPRAQEKVVLNATTNTTNTTNNTNTSTNTNSSDSCNDNDNNYIAVTMIILA